MVPIRTAKFAFLTFLIACAISTVLAEDRDISLRLRSDGATVPIAGCSDECSSPLKIHSKWYDPVAKIDKFGTYGIKLVDTGDASATKM